MATCWTMTSNSDHVNLSEINFKLKCDTHGKEIRENLNATGDNSNAIRADNTSNLPVADQLPLKTNVKYSKYLYKESDINASSNTGISNSDNIKQETESESSKYIEKSNFRSQQLKCGKYRSRAVTERIWLLQTSSHQMCPVCIYCTERTHKYVYYSLDCYFSFSFYNYYNLYFSS